jgi:anti-sigma B factor antagonist
MSHHECPDCGFRVSAIGAPSLCPRCLAGGRGRVGLVPAPMFDLPPHPDAPSTGPKTATQTFKVFENEIWPGCGEVRVEGEIDLATAAELEAALDRAAMRHRHVLVDLAACRFIDARGLDALVHAHRALEGRGAQLLLCGVHGQVERVLSVTGVAEHGLVLTGRKDPVEEAKARLLRERLDLGARAMSELDRRTDPGLAA